MKHLEITIPVGNNQHITGDLSLIPNSQSLVVFAHGSGSSRFSKRNQLVAEFLNKANISTLLFDLLTQEEDKIDQLTREFRFDINLLAERLVVVTKWLTSQSTTKNFKIGYFGASTGAAAALIAAAQLSKYVKAVVSRGGRPDLAGDYLPQVKSPTLLIVGERDPEVILLNKKAYQQLTAIKELSIIPKATHLFEEPGTLEEAAQLALDWFKKFLK